MDDDFCPYCLQSYSFLGKVRYFFWLTYHKLIGYFCFFRAEKPLHTDQPCKTDLHCHKPLKNNQVPVEIAQLFHVDELKKLLVKDKKSRKPKKKKAKRPYNKKKKQEEKDAVS